MDLKFGINKNEGFEKILEEIYKPVSNFKESNYLPAVFLLILTISGNFLAETFSCSVRELLENNFVAKQILLFFIIYFTNTFNAGDEGNPFDKLKKTFVIYIFFVMFSKMDLFFTIVGFGILCAIYINNDYYKFRLNQKKQVSGYYNILINSLRILLLLWTFTGFTIYFIKQKSKHKKNFNLKTFFIGKKACDNKNRYKD